MIKPKHKFNGGIGATLCHHCSVIITVGLTDELYCDKCKNMKEQQKRLLTEVMELDQKNGLYENQTAVEWLMQTIEKSLPNFIEAWHEEFEQAKQIEETQIRMAWTDGNMLGKNGLAVETYDDSKGYYSKNYRKD